MADSGPQTLFIVVFRDDFPSQWFCSILQFRSEENFFKTNKANRPQIRMKGLPALIKRALPSSSGNHLLQKEYIAHFRLLQPPASISWHFSPLTSTQELCMVPYVLSTSEHINHHLPSLHAHTFNFGTKTLKKITPCSIPSKPDRCVVSLGGYMYFMPQPYDFRFLPEQRSFERYNPVGNSWETLEPFPLPRDEKDIEFLHNISGTAVLDDSDTILFNMGDIWAYNVNNNSWYLVKVQDSLCYSFVGEAVVQENTIYALKDKSIESVILALSISIVRSEESNDGDLVYTCSLLSEISLPAISPILLREEAYSSRHLVRLGKDSLCLVCSCVHEGFLDYQPIQITYMKLAGTNSLIVTDNKVHKLRVGGSEKFRVSFCFSMPDCKTPPAVKQGNMFFDMDPFRVGFDINEIYQKHGKIYFNSETGQFVMPPFPTSPLVAKDEDDNVSSQTNMIDEHEFEQGGSKSRGLSAEEEDVPEKSSSSSVAGSSALSKASTISSSATHGDYPASPVFQTVGDELDYYTRGMSRAEAFKARSMLLDRWRGDLGRELLAKNSPFPEA